MGHNERTSSFKLNKVRLNLIKAFVVENFFANESEIYDNSFQFFQEDNFMNVFRNCYLYQEKY